MVISLSVLYLQESIIAQHPEMLFRDMLYQSTDKLLRRAVKIFVLIRLMIQEVKGYILAIVMP